MEFEADANDPKRQCWINQRLWKLKLYSPEDTFYFGEHTKSSIRCMVSHVFVRIKSQIGYRSIRKNVHRINMLFFLANLFTCDCWRRRGTWKIYPLPGGMG